MNKAMLLMVIVRRDWEDGFVSLLRRERVEPILSLPAQGTATQSLLNLLGLERLDKTLLCAMAPRHKAARLMRSMVSDMGINISGSGISLSIPVGSIGGQSSLNYFMKPGTDENKSRSDENNEVDHMEEKRPYSYDLIFAVTQQGNAQLVMDHARTAGAGGGTVLHAKGIGDEYMRNFFGVSLASEKEMIMIVTRREQKDAIMQAIMTGAGVNTPAQTVLFSLPVDDVVGLRSVMRDEEQP